MDDATRGDNRIGNKAEDRRLATDSEKIVIQAGQVMIEAAEQAVSEKRDPAKMLRVLSSWQLRSTTPVLLSGHLFSWIFARSGTSWLMGSAGAARQFCWPS